MSYFLNWRHTNSFYCFRCVTAPCTGMGQGAGPSFDEEFDDVGDEGGAGDDDDDDDMPDLERATVEEVD